MGRLHGSGYDRDDERTGKAVRREVATVRPLEGMEAASGFMQGTVRRRKDKGDDRVGRTLLRHIRQIGALPSTRTTC